MGLFDFLKKEKVSATAMDSEASGNMDGAYIIAAATKGTVIPMNEIPDPVFSDGVMGECCGIDPVEGRVFAPVNGKIAQVFETLHAVGITGDSGIEILLHVGVDTVSMNGDGFNVQVKEGDKVVLGQQLLTMDLNKIKAAGHPAVVITVLTNSDDYNKIELIASGDVTPGDDLMKLS